MSNIGHTTKNDKRKRVAYDSSDSEYEWKETTPNRCASHSHENPQDESWMTGLHSIDNFVETLTSSSSTLQRPVTSVREMSELNPYWKDCGTGLPDSTSSTSKSIMTRQNERWLFKSYSSCLEQARASRVDVREILMQRWNKATVDDMLEKFNNSMSRSFQEPDRSRADYPARSSDYTRPRWRKSTSRRCDSPVAENLDVSSSCASSQPQTNLLMELSAPSSADVSETEVREVTIDDINTMAAKLLRAELRSDSVKIQKLKRNLENLREAQRRGVKVRLHVTRKPTLGDERSGNTEPTGVLLTRLNDRGVEMPVSIPGLSSTLSRHQKSTQFRTHDARPERVAFEPDDASNRTVKELVHDERFRSSRDVVYEFARLAAKTRNNVEDEYADVFVSNRSASEREAHRVKRDAVNAYKRRRFAESSCTVCLERVPKHLVISVGEYVFLSLPGHVSLVPGHCLLTPYEHVGSTTRLDNSTIQELLRFKRQLVAMFHEHLNGSVCVFMETCSNPDSPRAHTQLECVPVSKVLLQSCPAYFKKSLTDLGSEWGQNTQLITLKSNGMGAYGVIPPKLGYFAVEFGLSDGGLVRVVDDKRDISSYFGREIIGQTLGKDSYFWRKPKSENFDRLRQKVVQFEGWWGPFDKWSQRDPRTHPPSDGPRSSSAPEGPELPPILSV